MKEVGKRIKYFRERKEWTVRDLAERVGLSAGYINQIELAKRKPNIDIIEKIASALNINIIDLFGDKQEIPDGLKDIGIEWITFSKEMKEKGLTPEEIKNIINVIQSLNKNT